MIGGTPAPRTTGPRGLGGNGHAGSCRRVPHRKLSPGTGNPTVLGGRQVVPGGPFPWGVQQYPNTSNNSRTPPPLREGSRWCQVHESARNRSDTFQPYNTRSSILVLSSPSKPNRRDSPRGPTGGKGRLRHWCGLEPQALTPRGQACQMRTWGAIVFSCAGAVEKLRTPDNLRSTPKLDQRPGTARKPSNPKRHPHTAKKHLLGEKKTTQERIFEVLVF